MYLMLYIRCSDEISHNRGGGEFFCTGHLHISHDLLYFVVYCIPIEQFHVIKYVEWANPSNKD